MNKIEWNEELSVGIAELDREHQVLFTMLNSLSDSIEGRERAEDMAGLLSEMTHFLRRHFDKEEAYLQRHGYSASAEHKRIHDQFRNLSDRFHWQADVRQLVDEIRSWLVEHITECDREYATFVAGRALPETVTSAECDRDDADPISRGSRSGADR